MECNGSAVAHNHRARRKDMVTDHALVRFMERHGNICLDGIRDIIAQICLEAIQNGENFLCTTDGMFIFEECKVITFLAYGQRPNIKKWPKKRRQKMEGLFKQWPPNFYWGA